MADIVDPVSRLVRATRNLVVHASNGVGSTERIEDEYTASRAELDDIITRLRAENEELRKQLAEAFERAAQIAEAAVIEADDTEEPGDDDWFSRMCANGQATVIADRIRKASGGSGA